MRILIKKAVCLACFCIIFTNQVFSQTIFEAVQAEPELQRLEEAMIASGINDILQPTAAYTVFAPSNSVMETLPVSLLQNPAALQDFLMTHFVNGIYQSNDFTDGFVLTSLNNRNLVIDIDGADISVQGISITTKDIDGGNGFIHIIDNLILRQNTTETTLWTLIANSSEHTILETVIREADLESEYRSDSFRTVFAPNDDAFLNLPMFRFDMLLGDNINFIKNVLDFHIVDSDVTFGQLTNDAIFTAANGQELTVTIDLNGTFIQNAKIIFSSVLAANGRLYVIEKVIFPEALPAFSIFDFIEDSEDHTTLEELVVAGELDTDLSRPGPLTMFAPTDDAFATLDPDFIADLINDPVRLDSILKNHLLADRFNVEELEDIEDFITVSLHQAGSIQAIATRFLALSWR